MCTMKSTGITRPVDDLGRFVIPKELRRSFELNNNDKLEIYTEGDRIILQKYVPGCIFCGEIENVVLFAHKRVCPACLAQLKKM